MTDESAADVAPDGSPVEVFDRLPPGRAPAYIAAAVRAGGAILELGCGAGRLTRALAAVGHPVTAVDVSPAMLARVVESPLVEVVLGDAATVSLGRRYDGVVLASYLVNDTERAPAFLATCRRHLAPGGVVVVQRYDPVWACAGRGGAALAGEVTVDVDRLEVVGTALRIGVSYRVGSRVWRQDVAAHLVDDDELERLAADSGLRVDGWLDEFRTWAALVFDPQVVSAGRDLP